MKDAVKKVNKTALDYFRQNQPVYTENELQEAIKIAHEAGVEAERKRLVDEVEKMKTIEKVMQVFPDGTELVENTGLVNVSDILILIRKRGLTNQGETK